LQPEKKREERRGELDCFIHVHQPMQWYYNYKEEKEKGRRGRREFVLGMYKTGSNLKANM